MFDPYTMQIMSWWALFGVALTAGLVISNDDGNSSSSGPSEPPIDPRLEPFSIFDDFNADSYEALNIGTPENDEIFAEPGLSAAINGDDGNDDIRGSILDDYILGGPGHDAIRGEDGDDIVRAGDGSDQVIGRAGNDTIYGEAGSDALNGSPGNDVVSGGDGDDLQIGWYGADTVLGGAGNDTLSGFRAIAAAPDAGVPEEADTLDGGDGNDELWLSNGDNGTGGAGKDLFLADWRSEETLDSITINDFNANEDKISLLITAPAEGAPMPEITQQVSEDGADRLVYMNGVEIARVIGTGSGEELDIETTTEPPDGIADNSEGIV